MFEPPGLATGPRRATSAGGSAADWRELLLGPDGLRLDEWRGRGPAHDRQDGAAPGRLPRRPARGGGLRQALPRARPAGPSSASGSAAARGATRASGPRASPRSACRRSRRSPWASSGSGSSCFENYLVTPRDPRDDPARRVRRAATSTDWPEPRRSRVRRRLATALARPDGPAARRRLRPPRLPPRQHPGPDRRRRPARLLR